MIRRSASASRFSPGLRARNNLNCGSEPDTFIPIPVMLCHKAITASRSVPTIARISTPIDFTTALKADALQSLLAEARLNTRETTEVCHGFGAGRWSSAALACRGSLKAGLQHFASHLRMHPHLAIRPAEKSIGLGLA